MMIVTVSSQITPCLPTLPNNMVFIVNEKENIFLTNIFHESIWKEAIFKCKEFDLRVLALLKHPLNV